MKMNLSTHIARRCSLAFTLTELMVSMGVFIFVIGGVITGYVTGLKYFQIAKPKLLASEDARKTLDNIVEDVRTAVAVKVGNGTISTFTPIAANQAQTGNAVEIQPGTNTTFLIRYYWDAADGRLRRTTSSTDPYPIVMNAVSNQVVFSAEDFQGITQSNNFNNRVVAIRMRFYQTARNVLRSGSGDYTDYYEFKSKITRRMLQ